MSRGAREILLPSINEVENELGRMVALVNQYCSNEEATVVCERIAEVLARISEVRESIPVAGAHGED
jgi:hypothetical protein